MSKKDYDMETQKYGNTIITKKRFDLSASSYMKIRTENSRIIGVEISDSGIDGVYYGYDAFIRYDDWKRIGKETGWDKI